MNEEILTNVDVVLYALFTLGGATKKIHTEKIAWESYQLSREKFSWSLNEFKKMGFPDKTTGRYALETAKKLNLVKGRGGKDKSGDEKEGWQFTPQGLDWIIKKQQEISGSLKTKTYISSTFTPKEKREIKKISNHKAYTSFKGNGSLNDVTEFDFIDLLDCSPDASNRVIQNKFDSLKNSVNLSNDLELKRFINEIGEKFSNLLRES